MKTLLLLPIEIVKNKRYNVRYRPDDNGKKTRQTWTQKMSVST